MEKLKRIVMLANSMLIMIIMNAQGVFGLVVGKILPHIVANSNLLAILASGKMFCRKIRSGISDRLVELLEQNRRQGELLIK